MKLRFAWTERLGYLFFIAALAPASLLGGNYTLIAVSVLFGAYVIFNEVRLALINRQKKRLAQNVVDVLDITARERLTEFSVPLVITSKDGDILWYNDAFTSALSESALFALHNVTQIDGRLLDEPTADVSFDGKYYTVHADRCRFSPTNQMRVFYFFDVTEHRALQKEYDLSRPVVTYLLIDNYDEIFSGMKESDRAADMAEVDRVINEWAAASGGILCHSDRERYLFVFERRALLEFVKARFDVMDRVRELTTHGKLSPTLSLGVGAGEDTYAENEANARAALDMALARGGDQTAIKSPGGFEFFGARERSGEKRTRIKTRVVANALTEQLKTVGNLLIMGHAYGDLDSLGAAVGFCRIARERAIPAKIVIDPETDLTGRLLEDLQADKDHRDWFVERREATEYLQADTAVVVVDTFTANRTVAPELLKKCKNVIVIDHHRKGTEAIEHPLICYQEPYASSTCEMITELFHYLDVVTIPAIEANALMAGIVLDTKNFTVRTNPSTFEASSVLRRAGADTVDVKRYFQTDLGTYADKNRFVAKTELYRRMFAVACWEGEPRGNIKIAAAQAADEMLNIENVRASFTLFTDRGGNTNISGRSLGAVNVQLILERFENGGGHLTMAGAFVPETPVDEARVRLLQLIDNYLEENGLPL